MGKMKKKPENPRLKLKKTKGRVKLLKATRYEGCMVYIRQYDQEIFTYDVVYKGQIYFHYHVAKMEVGQKKLTKEQIKFATDIVLSGALATVDVLTGKKLDEKEKQNAKIFEETMGSQRKKKMVN